MPQEMSLGPRTRVLAEGLGWAEGPAVAPDGSVFFVESYRSQVSVWEEGRGVRQFAYTAGAPNSCVLNADGSVVVCQNGGTTGPWRAAEQIAAGIQLISSDGSKVETIATHIDGYKLNGPNDLVWGPDGVLYITDPGEYRPSDPEPSRVYALRSDGTGSLLAELDPPTFPNGIAVTPEGHVIWAESYTGLIRRHTAAGVEVLATLPGDNPVADGMAIAANGDLWVTTVNGDGIEIFSADGTYQGHLTCGAFPTNVAWVGDGLLVLTDAGVLASSPEPNFTGHLRLLDVGQDGIGIWPGTLAP